MKRLPIGIENFKELIDHNYYYVDKTMFIQDVCNEKVILYTRPRRFGKTLNMSMLYYFFSIRQKENAYLFNGLEISKCMDVVSYQNQFPVIFITLKDMKNSSFDKQLVMFSLLIQEIISNHQELLTSDNINSIEKERIARLYRGVQNEVELQNALKFIVSCLYHHYRKKVILLIDEYDVPLQNAYLNGYYDEMVNFLRNVFSAAFKTNDALEKGVLTGCLRIAKESIFTGLNNFRVVSIFDEISNQRFGFTQPEIDMMLQDYQLKDYQKQMKEWYDGYQFGGCDIYNPWSALMYVDKLANTSRREPESFWANTSGNDIIYRYIKEANPKMRDEFDILAAGGMIEKAVKDDITYREMDQISNVYSFLLYTGYLKAIRCLDEDKRIYQLMIPNKEIKRVFLSIFSEWFDEQVEHSGNSFVEALMKEDLIQAADILNNILFQSISYFDYDEKFYHGLLIGMLSEYQTVSNGEAGLGRFDIAILPLSRMSRGVVLELKVAKQEEDLQKLSEEACRQIRDMKYIEGLQKKGYEDILGYGIAFYKKSCIITAL
ncbi:ATP-binding protein [[Clostridium] innocuum]|nr:ATP-binding protein [[Clostridium] innocuum]MCR0264280.1 ATP-binding protein [[Clostridium] innocuum]